MEPITRTEKLMAGQQLEPITRKELFLAKAAGMDVKTPEPITREEMFLNMITGGGADPVTEPITITANGSYEPPEGVDGYNPVTVNVPTGGGASEWSDLGESVTNLGDTLTWDGNTEGKVSVVQYVGGNPAGTYVKVSDAVLTREDFANGATLAINGNENAMTITWEQIEPYYTADYLSLDYINFVGVDNYTDELGITYPESGIYFANFPSLAVTSLTIPGYNFTESTIKPVPEKYLPDSVKGGGVSSWNDLTDKPFGEDLSDTLIIPRIDLATFDPSTLVGGAFYKASNQPVTMDDLTNGFTISVNGEVALDAPPEQVPEVAYTIVDGIISIADVIISVEEKGVGVNSDFGAFPDSGIYALIEVAYASAVAFTIPGFGKFENVKLIPEKYIPTGYKNVQPDWNQTDETAVNFIKNKPTVKQLYIRYDDNKDLLYLTETRGGSGTDLTYAEFEEIIRKYDISQIRISGNMAIAAQKCGTHGVMLYRAFYDTDGTRAVDKLCYTAEYVPPTT